MTRESSTAEQHPAPRADYTAAIHDELEDRDYFTEETVFRVPSLARWRPIRKNAALAPDTKVAPQVTQPQEPQDTLSAPPPARSPRSRHHAAEAAERNFRVAKTVFSPVTA